MDTDFLFNPLSHDERIIADKLGITEYATATPGFDLNQNLKLALMQEELERSKRRNELLEKQILSRDVDSMHEKFTGGSCGCGVESFRASKPRRHVEGCTVGNEVNKKSNAVNNTDKNDFGNNDDEYLVNLLGGRKILLLLIFILAAFCIIQYFSYKSEMKELVDNVYKMLQASGTNIANMSSPGITPAATNPTVSTTSPTAAISTTIPTTTQ